MSLSIKTLALTAGSLVLLVPMSASAVAVKDLADMLTNVQNNIPYVRQFILAFCYTMGIGFFLRAVFMFKVYGESRTMMSSHTSMIKPMVILGVGVGLFALPDLIDSSIKTVYNYGSQSVMQYPPATSWSSVINPLISIVKLLGLAVFVKGFMLLSKYGGEGGQQGGVGGKAALHMIGGILAMNIVATINVIKGTLGI